MTDSRQFVPELTAELDRLADGRTILRAPSPGLWREQPVLGSLLRSGDELGGLEILGVKHRLQVPEGAVGIVVDEGPHAELARRPVDYGALLVTLDPQALGGSLALEGASATAQQTTGNLQFRASSSGRFYACPAPDKPPFVSLGEIIERGRTIGLLEVMKTFTRIHYDDPKLPARAKIVAIVAADQADLDRGAVILELVAAED